MPFLGRDWRSPGDQWVRTNEGWEKLRLWRVKLFENLNENIIARLIRLAVAEWDGKRSELYKHQPYIHFIKGTTKERKILTSLSESFVHLDLTGAVKDVRRFNYVLKLLQLLLTTKLGNLSGTSQKHIFNILDEMVKQVLRTQNNIQALRELLVCAVKVLHEAEHSHIGSTQLWNRHRQSVNKMINRINKNQIKERADDEKLQFSDLPEECIRDILMCLTDHRDIIHTGQTNSVVQELSERQLLWKQLCFFHFTNKQLLIFLPEHMNEMMVDWKYIYRRCVKRFGKRDTFADMLAICSYCDNIFWKSIGHPCLSEEEPMSISLPPEKFIKLFHL
ncbi:hypothetical protein ScPMuIL_006987 [Solemya velum]